MSLRRPWWPKPGNKKQIADIGLKSAEMGPHSVDPGPHSAESGPKLDEVCRLPSSARCRAIWAERQPMLFRIRVMSAKVGPTSANLVDVD